MTQKNTNIQIEPNEIIVYFNQNIDESNRNIINKVANELANNGCNVSIGIKQKDSIFYKKMLV